MLASPSSKWKPQLVAFEMSGGGLLARQTADEDWTCWNTDAGGSWDPDGPTQEDKSVQCGTFFWIDPEGAVLSWDSAYVYFDGVVIFPRPGEEWTGPILGAWRWSDRLLVATDDALFDVTDQPVTPSTHPVLATRTGPDPRQGPNDSSVPALPFVASQSGHCAVACWRWRIARCELVEGVWGYTVEEQPAIDIPGVLSGDYNSTSADFGYLEADSSTGSGDFGLPWWLGGSRSWTGSRTVLESLSASWRFGTRWHGDAETPVLWVIDTDLEEIGGSGFEDISARVVTRNWLWDYYGNLYWQPSVIGPLTGRFRAHKVANATLKVRELTTVRLVAGEDSVEIFRRSRTEDRNCFFRLGDKEIVPAEIITESCGGVIAACEGDPPYPFDCCHPDAPTNDGRTLWTLDQWMEAYPDLLVSWDEAGGSIAVSSTETARRPRFANPTVAGIGVETTMTENEASGAWEGLASDCAKLEFGDATLTVGDGEQVMAFGRVVGELTEAMTSGPAGTRCCDDPPLYAGGNGTYTRALDQAIPLWALMEDPVVMEWHGAQSPDGVLIGKGPFGALVSGHPENSDVADPTVEVPDLFYVGAI